MKNASTSVLTLDRLRLAQTRVRAAAERAARAADEPADTDVRRRPALLPAR